MKTFGEAIRGWAEAPGRRRRLREATVFQVWDAAVGDVLARHAQPEHAARGVLHVVCDCAPWAQEVAVMKPDLIRSLNALLGEGVFRDLRIRISTLPPSMTAKDPAPPPWPAPARVQKWPENLDPHLTRALERLYRGTRPGGRRRGSERG